VGLNIVIAAYFFIKTKARIFLILHYLDELSTCCVGFIVRVIGTQIVWK